MLQQMGQDVPASKPTLEVNPDHPLIKKLESSEQFDDLAQVIRAGAYDFPHPSTNDLGENGKALHRHILESNIQQLTHLTRIALDASGALRRYVQGVMHIDATGEEQGNQSEKEN